jgi:hypothetical protein
MVNKLPNTRHTQTNCGKKLKGWLMIKRQLAMLIMHAMPMKSNHNDKHTTQQHVPKAMIEKLPKVTLA